MSSELTSKRIIYYDLIRAFAIFGVLSCHIFAILVTNKSIFNTPLWYYSLFFNSLREVSVPLFICVSGALLISKKDSLIVFIKKRFNRVFIPYIFWIMIFIVFEMIIFEMNDPTGLIINTFSIPPMGNSVFLWFVQMILVVYIVIFILNKLINYNKFFLKLIGVFSILFIILLNFNIIPTYSWPYSYIYYSIFAIIGFYLSTYDFKSNKLLKYMNISNEKLVCIFFILSILLYLFEIYYSITTSLRLNLNSAVSQFSFLNIALVISVFLFFRYFSESNGKFNKICKYIEKRKFGKIIFSISFCSYGIYLCHILIKDFLNKVLIFKDYLSPSAYTTLLLFLTLICSWLLILTMSKIPILKFVSGK